MAGEIVLISERIIYKSDVDKSYLECNLPTWLEESIQAYMENKNGSLWNCYYCELQSDINVCEVESLITSEQAWYLRYKYLYKEECSNG